jgi:TrpR family transcriptional regulator, trp operon repressor
MKKISNWHNFLKLCLKSKTIDELSKLFDLFMSFEEKEMLASRYAIVKCLLENKLSQREIAEKIQVSIAQITRGSNELKHFSEKFKQKLLDHFEGEPS